MLPFGASYHLWILFSFCGIFYFVCQELHEEELVCSGQKCKS